MQVETAKLKHWVVGCGALIKEVWTATDLKGMRPQRAAYPLDHCGFICASHEERIWFGPVCDADVVHRIANLIV